MHNKIIFCFLSGCFLFSCSSEKHQDASENAESGAIHTDKPTEVKVLRLEPVDFSYELISNGVISAGKKADLQFQSTENILHIYVKNGDRVGKGQKIAELDKFKLKNTLEQAKDNLERAKLELQDVLIGQGYSLNDTTEIPKNVMEIAKTRSNYTQSLNNYQLAVYNLNAATLYAPFPGTVANLFTKQYNQPSGVFCTIVDNQQPEAVFTVLESELPLVNPGDKVLISSYAVNDYSTEGRITEINPLVDKNGMVRIKAGIDNKKGKLYDGMNIKIRIQRHLGKQLVIPKEALVLRTNKKVVFTFKNNNAVWNYVQTDRENSQSFVITEGLNEGDSVIYEGNINLAHESPVRVKSEE